MLFATKKHLCVFKRNTQRFYFGELQGGTEISVMLASLPKGLLSLVYSKYAVQTLYLFEYLFSYLVCLEAFF